MPSKNTTPMPAKRRAAMNVKHKKGVHKKDTFENRLDQFLDRLYRLAYYIGAQTVRRERRISRDLEIGYKRTRDKLTAKSKKIHATIIRKTKTVFREAFLPILSIRTKFAQYQERLTKAKATGKARGRREFWHIVWEVICTNAHIIGGMLNYIAPIAAAIVLITMVSHFTNLNFALSVNYNGQNVGYIQDETVFENAEKEVKKRIIYEETPVATVPANTIETRAIPLVAAPEPSAPPPKDVVAIPQYTLAIVEENQLVSEDELTNHIIQASGSEIIQASGLYIGGNFRGASTNPELVLDAMNDMLNAYETDNEDETIHFVSKIAMKDGLYPVQSLKDVQSMTAMMQGNESGESHYIVEAGDNPSLIADKTGVPLREITALNPNLTDHFLPGKEILISRSVPVMKVQVTRREVYEEDIPFKVDTVESAEFIKGYDQITKNGVPGTKEVEARITYVDGIETGRVIVKETPLTEPENAIRTLGTNIPKASGNGNNNGFIWPAKGGYISCPIWGYYGHTGTDIAGNSGTPILAARDGVVVVATQTRYGYGKYIIIDHGNGITTLYGHNSALHVSVGQRVQQGQVIASMGRTGNASGNHVHFEIRQGGRYLDARPYIGYSCPY